MAKRKLISVQSGFLKRPSDLVGQPVQSTKKSRRETRSSIKFVLAYASHTVAVYLDRGPGDFPDNYCLGRSSTNNWYYVARQPSLRAARRIVMMGLDNPELVINLLPYTVRELSIQHSRYFEMLKMVSREEFFPKPNRTCCYARRYHTPSILVEYCRDRSRYLPAYGDARNLISGDPWVLCLKLFGTRHYTKPPWNNSKWMKDLLRRPPEF